MLFILAIVNIGSALYSSHALNPDRTVKAIAVTPTPIIIGRTMVEFAFLCLWPLYTRKTISVIFFFICKARSFRRYAIDGQLYKKESLKLQYLVKFRFSSRLVLDDYSSGMSSSEDDSEEDTCDDPQLKSFHNYLRQAQKILCVVGSGLSQDSGIPTYRLQNGSWKGYTSLDLATPEAFQSNPGLVWLFYSNRRYIAMKARPNDGHYALASLSKKCKDCRKEVLIVTQNVDGLHQKAGQLEEDLCELHGSLFDLQCTSFFCTYRGKNTKSLFLTSSLREHTPRDVGVKRRYRDQLFPSKKKSKKSSLPLSNIERENDKESGMSSSDFDPLPHITKEDLPQCPQCKEGLLRPGVVWFGEPLPLSQMDKVDKFFVKETNDPNNSFPLAEKIGLVLVIGTSGKVWPAMGYVERCRQDGGKVAIFNTKIDDIKAVRKDKNVWGFQGEASYWLPKALQPIIGRNIHPRNQQQR